MTTAKSMMNPSHSGEPKTRDPETGLKIVPRFVPQIDPVVVHFSDIYAATVLPMRSQDQRNREGVVTNT